MKSSWKKLINELIKGGEIGTGELIDESKKDFNMFPQHLISSDDIENCGEKWICIENIPENLRDGIYITNARNEHWFLLIIQKPDIFMIDPISPTKNKTDIPTKHKELINFGKNNGFKNIYSSEVEVQPIKSSLCGYICLYLAKKLKPMMGKLTYDKIEKYLDDNFYDLNKQGGNKQQLFNVKKIIEWCNKMGVC